MAALLASGRRFMSLKVHLLAPFVKHIVQFDGLLLIVGFTCSEKQDIMLLFIADMAAPLSFRGGLMQRK